MHSCLFIDEILVNIVSLCSGDAAVVARLGLICRAFYEPVMDVLWARTPFVLGKLLFCLPEDAVDATWYTVHFRGSATSYYLEFGGFRRTILPSEWDRFMHHARRVKSIELDILPPVVSHDTAHMHSVYGATQTFFEALRERFHGGPVFPGLEELSASDFFEPWMDLFVHRGLISFHLENDDPRVLPKIFAQLAPCSSSLRTVHTTLLGPCDREEVHAHESLLALCANLTSFRTNCSVTLSMLHNLATANHLTTLHLISPLRPFYHIPELPQRRMLFESLQCLQLSSSAENLTDFLLVASLPAIRRIQLSPVVDNPEARSTVLSISIPHACLLINALAKFSSLEEVHVYLCPSAGSADILSGDALLVLAQLHNITCLSIPIRRVCLRPDHIATLAAAWPKLQSLVLGPWDPQIVIADTDFHPSICIEDLLPFAQRCPSLHTLALAIAGDIAPLVPFAADESRTVHRNLQELRLQESYLQSGWECTRVAKFLSAVFPCAHNKLLMNDRRRGDEITAVLLQEATLTDTRDLRAGFFGRS